MGYTTMRHNTGSCRSVLQYCVAVGEETRYKGYEVPANPGILWNLHKEVPDGIQVCQDG